MGNKRNKTKARIAQLNDIKNTILGWTSQDARAMITNPTMLPPTEFLGPGRRMPNGSIEYEVNPFPRRLGEL